MRLSKSLEQAYLALSQLDPLEDDASAPEKEYLTYIHRIAGLVHMQTSGLMEASGIEPDQGNWLELELPDANIAPTPQQRFREIIRHQFFDSPNDPEHWIPKILQPVTHGSMLQQEQAAFLALFQGYNKADSTLELTDFMGSENYDGTFDTLFQRMINIDRNPDSPKRLIDRFHLAADLVIDSTIQNFLHAMLGIIQAVKFAIEWDQLDNKGKQQYRQEMFAAFYPFHDEVAPQLQRKHKAAFASRHNKVVKSRQDIKNLYHKFGAAVLMDPIWNPTASYLNGSTGRSPTFPDTLSLVLASPHTSAVNSTLALEQLLALFGGQIEQFVTNFIVD